MSINKRTFLQSRICRTRGWYYYHDKDVSEPTPGQQLRMEEGREIGDLARKLFPNGILIEEDGERAIQKSRDAIDGGASALFEAYFCSSGYVTRPDILLNKEGCWELIEVKSSTDFSQKSEQKKQELIDDIAYTLMIIGNSISITKTTIITLSKDFRLGMDLSQLFVMSDVTVDVFSRRKVFEEIKDVILNQISLSERPMPSWIYECRDCEFFKKKCLGKNISNPIFNLPRINEKKCRKLFAESIYQIESIAKDFNLTDKQKIVKDVTDSQKEYVGDALRSQLDAIVWPVYYLDFETIKTAYPLYHNLAPHEQVLTQYSLHKLNVIDGEPNHSEYLGDPKKDCRHELIKHLLNDIGQEGSIIVYSSFEKTMINRLKKTFPDLEPDLDLII